MFLASAPSGPHVPASVQHAISGIGNPFPGILGALIVFVAVMAIIQGLKAIFS
jgi:hypothetical protein